MSMTKNTIMASRWQRLVDLMQEKWSQWSGDLRQGAVCYSSDWTATFASATDETTMRFRYLHECAASAVNLFHNGYSEQTRQQEDQQLVKSLGELYAFEFKHILAPLIVEHIPVDDLVSLIGSYLNWGVVTKGS